MELPNNVFVAPQWCVTRRMVSNDDEIKKSSQVPDFCILHREYEYSGIPISATLQVPLENVFITRNKVFVIIEIKPLEPYWTRDDITSKMDSHEDQLKTQAKYVFASSPQHSVMGILTIGHYYSCFRFYRNNLSPCSVNEDPTYIAEDNRIVSGYDSIGSGILGITDISNLRMLIVQQLGLL
jgi:hypothetical protein